MSVRTNACVFAFLCCLGASGAKGLSRQPCTPLECVVSLPGPVSTGCNSEVVSEAVALAFLTSTNDNVCAKIEVNRMRLIPPTARLHMLVPFSCTKQCELTHPHRGASCTPTEHMRQTSLKASLYAGLVLRTESELSLCHRRESTAVPSNSNEPYSGFLPRFWRIRCHSSI